MAVETPRRGRGALRFYQLLSLLLLLLLLLLAYFCFVRPEPPAFAGCDETPSPRIPAALQPERGARLIPGEVVVRGEPALAEAVAREAQAAADGVAYVRCAAPAVGAGGGAAALYQVPAGSELAFITAFYQALQARSDAEDDPTLLTAAAADPNYVIGYLIEGDPSNGHAGIAGTLAAAPPVQALGTPAQLFATQWALGEAPGIGLYAAGRRQVDLDGSGVAVYVFDTSPLPDGPAVLDAAVYGGTAMDLNVVTPVTLPTFSYPPAGSPAEAAKLHVADHGLYAAGMVAAVAPGTEITLVRVLNERGQGDLFTLLAAMADQLTGGPAVANLSLGLGPDFTPPPALVTLYGGLAGRLPAGDANPFAGAAPIPTLQLALTAAREAGVVVVAASGNDSAGGVLGAQLPAAFPQAVAVGGHDYTGERSCFANAAQLTAPAGSGSVSADLLGSAARQSSVDGSRLAEFVAKSALADGACVPELITAACSALAADLTVPGQLPFVDCPLALTGPVAQSTYVDGFAYWIGTSFATPLVGGLAALALGEGVTAPADVEAALFCATPDGATAALAPDVSRPAGGGGVTLPRFLACIGR